MRPCVVKLTYRPENISSCPPRLVVVVCTVETSSSFWGGRSRRSERPKRDAEVRLGVTGSGFFDTRVADSRDRTETTKVPVARPGRTEGPGEGVGPRPRVGGPPARLLSAIYREARRWVARAVLATPTASAPRTKYFLYLGWTTCYYYFL